VCDEDVGRLAGLALADADRLRRRGGLRERLRLQSAGEPDLGRRPRDDASLPVDDEERVAHVTGAEVGRTGNDGDVLTRSAPKRLERRGVRLLLR
jgi:hypothetical protein